MMKKNESNPQNMAQEYDQALLDSGRSNSRFAEAYRTLRTNIHFSAADKRVRSVLVTSAGQSEGKTITSANLAFTISQTGKSVLLVDADLRKPMLSKLFKARNNTGLTGLMNDVFQADIRGGLLEEISVNDIFRIISLQKRSGSLALDDGEDKIEIVFLSGKPFEIEWLTRPEEKKLASVLVRSGIISKENAEIVIRRQKDTGQKLGRILMNMGLTGENELKGPMNIHIAESLQILSRMKNGSFIFSDRPESRFDSSDSFCCELEEMCGQILGRDEDLIWLGQKINAAIMPTEVPGLSLLPSGIIPPNPSELLGSERMSFLISYLEKRFDFMLIDTPPILPASDALLVAPQVDGVALVLKAGMLSRKMVVKAVEQLRRAQANLLGVILNRVDVKREGYYKYYQKYYNYYYSEAK